MGVVRDELAKMHEHLLAPLGVAAVPATIDEAVAAYVPAADEAAARLGVELPLELRDEVLPAVLDA